MNRKKTVLDEMTCPICLLLTMYIQKIFCDNDHEKANELIVGHVLFFGSYTFFIAQLFSFFSLLSLVGEVEKWSKNRTCALMALFMLETVKVVLTYLTSVKSSVVTTERIKVDDSIYYT